FLFIVSNDSLKLLKIVCSFKFILALKLKAVVQDHRQIIAVFITEIHDIIVNSPKHLSVGGHPVGCPLINDKSPIFRVWVLLKNVSLGINEMLHRCRRPFVWIAPRIEINTYVSIDPGKSPFNKLTTDVFPSPKLP